MKVRNAIIALLAAIWRAIKWCCHTIADFLADFKRPEGNTATANFAERIKLTHQKSVEKYHTDQAQRNQKMVLAIAHADYPYVADIVFNTIVQNASALGLMAPATSQQLMVPNGIALSRNNRVGFMLVIRRQWTDKRSEIDLCRDIHVALSAYTYGTLDLYGNPLHALVVVQLQRIDGSDGYKLVVRCA